MNRIIKSHLDNFAANFSLTDLPESEQFERFVNYAVLMPKISTNFDLDDVTTGEGDDGTDGIALIVDEELVVSKEDAEIAFKSDRKNHDVEIVFIQTKRSDSFELGDFLKFKESVLKFVKTDDHYSATDEVQVNANCIYDVCLNNVPKIRGGKPSITVRFVTTGVYNEPDALETAKKKFERELTRIFHKKGKDYYKRLIE